MQAKITNGVAHVFIDGTEFDEIVRSFDLTAEDESCRPLWLSERFTRQILRSDDSEYLFAKCDLGNDVASLFLIDEAFESEYQAWWLRRIESLN